MKAGRRATHNKVNEERAQKRREEYTRKALQTGSVAYLSLSSSADTLVHAARRARKRCGVQHKAQQMKALGHATHNETSEGHTESVTDLSLFSSVGIPTHVQRVVHESVVSCNTQNNR